MRVGKSKKANATCIRRSEASLNHAIRKIKESGIAPYVSGLYLYGSCARKEQDFNSDVDLLLELSPDFNTKRYRDVVILLKGSVSPSALELPDVDLKVVIGDSWKSNNMLYYKNIKWRELMYGKFIRIIF